MADLLSVAKLAGVSRATAARAFSSPDLVRPATREKVFNAAQQLAFRPNKIAQTLRLETTPCLLVYSPPGKSGFPSIGVDNRAASADATRHLITLGHERIGMVAGPLLQSDRARLRFDGYCHAMGEAGLIARSLVEMTRHTQADLKSLPSA